MPSLIARATLAGFLAITVNSATLAPTPPMGWNSFDAFDCTITEAQFKAEVDFMARELLAYGWQYAVIDYIWFNPNPGNWNNPARRLGHPDVRLDRNGRPLDRLAMDANGRLLPAIERFPSAAGGKGFRAIADYVHKRGLKFGIHIMRGIPRQAYYDNLPILGSSHTAREIADPSDQCPWNNNMFGVDPKKPGAQEYYDSLLRLYADWGVDFIKADDMLYPVYHGGELELLRKAIDRCGRPMVLSLSPGEAPLAQADHLRKNAQMWRVSADFWDDWKALKHNFELLDAWSKYIALGSWPDADMLPIGHISIHGRPHGPDRLSNLTWPEHYMLFTLAAIARSPLIMGGDLLTSPEKSLAFLKNKEVIAVDQNSTGNHQVSRDDTSAVWMASVPGSPDRYLALFNLSPSKRLIGLRLDGAYRVRDLWSHSDAGVANHEFHAEIDPHGAGLYRLSPR